MPEGEGGKDVNEYIPPYLRDEYWSFRAAKILGISPDEAFWLDDAEIFRAISFAVAESFAE